MSRTYRRKNYELTQNTSWDRKYRHVLPENAYADYVYRWVKTTATHHHYRNELIVEYYDKRRLRHEFRWKHGDNHSGNWSPKKWWRQMYHNENRGYNRNEIHKFMKDPDNYEPMCREEPRSPYWD